MNDQLIQKAIDRLNWSSIVQNKCGHMPSHANIYWTLMESGSLG